MKPITKSVLAGLLLITSHSFAATYTLHISGSTAFRGSTVNAIVNYLSAGGVVKGAYSDTSLTGASEQVFTGSINGGADTLVVETCWTGSAQGIHDDANGTVPPIPSVGGVPLGGVWMGAANATVAVNPAVAPSSVTGGSLVAAPVYDPAVAPDVAMSDVWQSSTLFPAPALNDVIPNGVALQGFVMVASGNAPVPGSGVATFTTTAGSYTVTAPAFVVSLLQVGDQLAPLAGVIPPFAAIKKIDSATTFDITVPALATGSNNVTVTQPGWTNITDQQARALWTKGNGTLPLSQFDGLPADSTKTVVAIGRSPDSGTRLTFTDETGIDGATSTNGAGQYNQLAENFPYNGTAVVSSATTQITSFALTPVNTFNGLTLALGDDGYTSGGTVAKVIQNVTAAPFGYLMVTPLGQSDAKTAILGGATELTYNGQVYNGVNIEVGNYSLWSYEHMYSALPAGQLLTSATAIGNQLLTSDALVNGDLISNMLVSRHPITSVGGTIY
jgi:hypothetical protein